jgi:pimeloyl-ACP methyl ester carboxylesterase
MATIVLIPGAGLGGWAWSRVTPALRAAGHDPHPITLTGTGDRAHLVHRELDVSAWATDVIAHLETEELTDVVLVGHSFAGTVAAVVAERAPERLRHVVLLEGILARDGASVFDLYGPQMAAMFEQLAAENDGWRLPWLSDEQLDAHYGEHGLTGEDRAWMRRHVTGQPLASYRERLRIANPAAAALAHTYVKCSGTPSPSPIEPGTPDWQTETIDSGHWPMVSAPRATAELLAAIAAS